MTKSAGMNNVISIKRFLTPGCVNNQEASELKICGYKGTHNDMKLTF